MHAQLALGVNKGSFTVIKVGGPCPATGMTHLQTNVQQETFTGEDFYKLAWWKIHFCREHFHELLTAAMYQWMPCPQILRRKLSQNSIVAKFFSLESFPLYSIHIYTLQSHQDIQFCVQQRHIKQISCSSSVPTSSETCHFNCHTLQTMHDSSKDLCAGLRTHWLCSQHTGYLEFGTSPPNINVFTHC